MVSTWLLAAALAPGLHDPADQGDAPTAATVYRLEKPAFRIPFHLNSYQPQQIEEIRLLVSTDHGQSWLGAATATPDELAFEFKAKKTGEHWFAVQVKRKNGRLVPPDEDQFRPLLKVHVGAVEDSGQPVKAALLQEEADKLDEKLTEIELDLIRNELKRMAERKELSAETEERIDRLRERLRGAQLRLQERDRSLKAFPSADSWVPPAPGPATPYPAPNLQPVPEPTPVPPAVGRTPQSSKNPLLSPAGRCRIEFYELTPIEGPPQPAPARPR